MLYAIVLPDHFQHNRTRWRYTGAPILRQITGMMVLLMLSRNFSRPDNPWVGSQPSLRENRYIIRIASQKIVP